MPRVTMKELLEAGVHFGHKTNRWHPKMKPYIFTERNGVHIIDLQQTIRAIDSTYELVRDKVAQGGVILFVGTKRQAQETIAAEAQRCQMPYVNYRWLGGTLTNWRTIRERIRYYIQLDEMIRNGGLETMPKKEAIRLRRKYEKMRLKFEGLRPLKRLPDMLFVVDTMREATAIREANALNIPVIAMVDTNCDPDPIDYIIPANDDAIRSIKLITRLMADAVLEGLQLREKIGVAEVPTEEEEIEEAVPALEPRRVFEAEEEEAEEEIEEEIGEELEELP
ncbi:MAG: 30S ribosomal protein S2 [Thermoflexus sp.]|jgi:small subunit ribosomal protein S2|uniref:30S ribosomal protein S2 n=1 Tax=Thermoflexus TaxID=1495649 RepID=UPI001C79326E|nr:MULTISPECIES: 30S ribosomal protein S2 [Thermoflexus]MDT7884903.1 30S ribosomal protein S2 [Thermoflexus sp.]MDT7948867.1 30S ribosomal protein S2 [Thermoflexus sp.]QWK10625.1 MAG: 30S ribosomal protein S2 [Thermoflexus hugenholtzii]